MGVFVFVNYTKNKKIIYFISLDITPLDYYDYISFLFISFISSWEMKIPIQQETATQKTAVPSIHIISELFALLASLISYCAGCLTC